MKKIVKNLETKTQGVLFESVIDEVAELLGVEASELEDPIDRLTFSDYLELGNAVDIGDEDLAREILGMVGGLGEVSAFDADDDEDDEDSGINFVDQIGDDGDSDDTEDDDLYIDDDEWLEESMTGGMGGMIGLILGLLINDATIYGLMVRDRTGKFLPFPLIRKLTRKLKAIGAGETIARIESDMYKKGEYIELNKAAKEGNREKFLAIVKSMYGENEINHLEKAVNYLYNDIKDLYYPINEADNAYGGGGGDNSFSKTPAQPKVSDDEEDEEVLDGDDSEQNNTLDQTSISQLKAKATTQATQKQARATTSLSPAERTAAMQRLKSLKQGDEVFVRGLDGKPVKATYQGADKSRQDFMAAVKSDKDRANTRTFGYDDLIMADELGDDEMKESYGDYDFEERDSVEAVKRAIYQRIRTRHLDLVDKYGIDAVNAAVDSAAYFYGSGGLEEIGSSDVSAFVNSVAMELGEPDMFRESSGPKGWPKPKDPWTPDTKIPAKFYRNGKLVKDQKYKDWVDSQRDMVEEDADLERMKALAGIKSEPVTESARYGIYRRSKMDWEGWQNDGWKGNTQAASAQVKRGGKHLTFKSKGAAEKWAKENSKKEEFFVRKVSKPVKPVKESLSGTLPKGTVIQTTYKGRTVKGNIIRFTRGRGPKQPAFYTIDVNGLEVSVPVIGTDAVVQETASGGSTGAGSIASAPAAVGGMQKRNPSIYATAKKPEPKPKPSKKGKKEDGLGRPKKS